MTAKDMLSKHAEFDMDFSGSWVLKAMEEYAMMKADKAFDAGKKKGHWEGRLAILNLPGSNYAGGDYMTGATRHNKNTPDKEEFMKSLFPLKEI